MMIPEWSERQREYSRVSVFFCGRRSGQLRACDGGMMLPTRARQIDETWQRAHPNIGWCSEEFTLFPPQAD
jgi:hypothetical protein